MSDKEFAIEIIQKLPDDMNLIDIISHLNQHPQRASSDQTDEDWTSEDLSPEEWAKVVSHALGNELGDSREDIYTMKDGEPPNGSG